jgi:hypothetical protein
MSSGPLEHLADALGVDYDLVNNKALEVGNLESILLSLMAPRYGMKKFSARHGSYGKVTRVFIVRCKSAETDSGCVSCH